MLSQIPGLNVLGIRTQCVNLTPHAWIMSRA
jgi:hypothetical protein